MNTGRSVPLAAAALLLVIAVLLGGAWLFIRRDSAAVGPVSSGAAFTPSPAPTPVPTAVPSKPALMAPTLTAAPLATAMQPTTPPAAITAPAAAPGVGPTAEPTVLLSVTLARVNGTSVVLLPGTPTPVPAWWQRMEETPPALVQGLVAGYLRFWDVRAQALLTLHTAPLNEVMSGDPLRDELAAIERLRSSNQAQRVDIGHSITVLWATADRGAVSDELEDRTTIVPLGATTQAAPSPPANPYRMAYLLQRTSNGWQVVDSVRIAR